MLKTRARALFVLALLAASGANLLISRLYAQNNAPPQPNRVKQISDAGTSPTATIPGHIPAWAVPQNDLGPIPAAQ